MVPLDILANPNCSDCLVPTRDTAGRDSVEWPECGERQQWDPQKNGWVGQDEGEAQKI